MAGYAYIYRQYGRSFRIGQPVRHTESGRVGVVAPDRGANHYVKVRVNGERALWHPAATEVIAEPPTSAR